MGKSSIFIEKRVSQEALDLARKHFPVGSNGKRGKAAATVNALAHMYEIAKETWPITGRGVGYRLLNRGVIRTMADSTFGSGQNTEGCMMRTISTSAWHWIQALSAL